MALGQREVGGSIFGFGDIDDFTTDSPIRIPRKRKARRKIVTRRKTSRTIKRRRTPRGKSERGKLITRKEGNRTKYYLQEKHDL